MIDDSQARRLEVDSNFVSPATAALRGGVSS